jgi:branched-chain amino acid transport system permease protein
MSQATAPAGRATLRLTKEESKRLGICLAVGVVVALVTGPSGSNTAPTSGITGTLKSPRVVLCLVLGALVWAVNLAWTRDVGGIRELLKRTSTGGSMILSDRRVRYSGYGALLLLAVLIPPFLSAFWQEVTVDQIGIYVLLALGLNVVVGFAGLLDLGYIAFFAIGAYVAAYFSGGLPVQPPVHLNLFFVFPIAVAACILAGIILGVPTLRLRGDYLAIVTLGFGEIVDIMANNTTSITGGPIGTKPLPHFSVNIFGIHYQWTLSQLPYYYLMLVVLVVVIIAFTLLENSRVGRAWVAIREDEVAAEACGINALKYKVMAFAIGASTSGFAGVIFAGKNNFFNPQVFSVQFSILILVLVIFGGMGSIVGVIVGAMFLQWLPQELRGHINEQDLYLYIGLLLVVMMIFRPQGMIPSKRRAREIGMAEEGVGTADALAPPGEAP